MTFQLSTKRLPSSWYFSSYNKALAYHDSVTPQRNTGIRPLALNRKGPTQIKVNRHGVVELVLHSTPVITITPNNRLYLDLSYNSNSTRAFANALFPFTWSFFTFAYQNVMHEIPTRKQFFLSKAEFDLTTGQMITQPPEIEVRYVNEEKTELALQILRTAKQFITAANAIYPDYLTTLRTSLSDKPVPSFNELLQHVDANNLETVIPLIENTVKQNRRFSVYTEAILNQLKFALYNYYNCYIWRTIPLGVLPNKSQIFRMVETT